MKVTIPITVQAGNDLSDSATIDLEVTVDADQIAQAVADSRGLEPLHIITTVQNVNQFFKDIPADTLEKMTPTQRQCCAKALREIAERLNNTGRQVRRESEHENS